MKKFLAFLLALVMVLSLAACGASKEDAQDAEDQQQEETTTQDTEAVTPQQQDTEPATDSDDDYTFDVQEDDHTVVVTTDSVIMVFTHDGTNITGYTGYVDCGNAADAKARVAQVKAAGEAYFNDEGIKSITAKGKYAVIEYTEKAFAVTTYEELHSLVEMYKQVQQ